MTSVMQLDASVRRPLDRRAGRATVWSEDCRFSLVAHLAQEALELHIALGEPDIAPRQVRARAVCVRFGDAQRLLEVVLCLVPLARGVRQAAKLQESVACNVQGECGDFRASPVEEKGLRSSACVRVCNGSGGCGWLLSLAFAVLIAQSARELQLPLRAGLGCGGIDLAADHAKVAARQALPACARERSASAEGQR